MTLPPPTAVRRCSAEQLLDNVAALLRDKPRHPILIQAAHHDADYLLLAYPPWTEFGAHAEPPASLGARGRLRITGVTINDGEVTFTVTGGEQP